MVVYNNDGFDMSELKQLLTQFRNAKKALTDCKNSNIGTCDVVLLERYGRLKEHSIDIGPSDIDPGYREIYIKNGQVKAFKASKIRSLTDDEKQFLPVWVKRLQSCASNT